MLSSLFRVVTGRTRSQRARRPEEVRRPHTTRMVAAGLAAVTTALVVTSCSGARGSAAGEGYAQATSTLTTIGPTTFSREVCLERLKPTIAALRPQTPPRTDPSVIRHEQTINAAQLDLAYASARLNTALNASLFDACTNALTAGRVTRCLSDLSVALGSLTDQAALALGYASFALEVAPTTKQNQTHEMDLAVLRARKGIESSLRDQLLACPAMQSRSRQPS